MSASLGCSTKWVTEITTKTKHTQSDLSLVPGFLFLHIGVTICLSIASPSKYLSIISPVGPPLTQ